MRAKRKGKDPGFQPSFRPSPFSVILFPPCAVCLHTRGRGLWILTPLLGFVVRALGHSARFETTFQSGLGFAGYERGRAGGFSIDSLSQLRSRQW